MSQRIYKHAAELIGGTPLLELSGYNKQHGVTARIVGKLEFLNPAGSVKDRVALAMIEDAERRGLLSSGSTIIEPTSGNTGIGLASVAAAKGYRLILTMPDSMSLERRSLLRAYGAELVLTEGAKGMDGAIKRAEELLAQTDNSVMLGQFSNSANPSVHFSTTGKEIWDGTGGKIDFFVSGVGTGGTISGAGALLKSKNPSIKVIAVEPLSSPVLSKGIKGAHKIQGIGAGFVPSTLDTKVFDSIVTVSDMDAFATCRAVAKTDGLLVGISSGAAIWAATQIALLPENSGKLIVVILPDSGERYISSGLFDKDEN